MTHKLVLPNVEIELDAAQVAEWGELLTGLDAAALEVLRIELRLDAAQEAGIILWWSPDKPHPTDWRYRIQHNHPDGIRREWQPQEYSYTTRLAAAQAALAYVETLEAEAEKPPKLEEMEWGQIVVELGELGCTIKKGSKSKGPVVYMRDGTNSYWRADKIGGLRAALREARELAAKEAPHAD